MKNDWIELDGLQLANLLRAGIYRLFEKTDHINKINVFPVPDGDTGTNMSLTLSAVLASLDRGPEPHAGSMLVRAADAALDGARGNSGAILAQFLLGLGDAAGHLSRLSIGEFVIALRKGAGYAKEALSQPREGTILTVLREFADAAEAQAVRSQDFRSLFTHSLTRVNEALEATRHQLEELRSANVVDAGALGFVEVLEGMRRFLDTGELGTAVAPVHTGDELMAGSAAPSADQDYRYCTECLITAKVGTEIDLRQLRETLAASGASLVVSGSKRKAKIHIHVDDPETIFRIAEDFGELSGQKADDMRMQQSAAHHRRAQRVAVVVDSGADIPEDLAERYGIHVVPVRIHFATHSYLDKVSMTPGEFYRELVTNPTHPKTSQPPPGDFRRMFEFLASHYDAVVSVNLTSRHSGTWDAATKAAQRVATEGKPVSAVDSRNASVGQGLIAIAAAEAAAQGADAPAVVAATQAAMDQTQTFALLGSIDFAVRGGRVPAIVGNIARLLGLNVILRTWPDGRISAGGGLFGSVKLRTRFARFVARRYRIDAGRERVRILVGHGDRLEEGRLLAEELVDRFPKDAVDFCLLTDMGPAIGVHGGPGTLIVALQRIPKN
ncbi:MAG: DAK2 domain-containing protein [Steroidobacteraceae bacterium]